MVSGVVPGFKIVDGGFVVNFGEIILDSMGSYNRFSLTLVLCTILSSEHSLIWSR